MSEARSFGLVHWLKRRIGLGGGPAGSQESADDEDEPVKDYSWLDDLGAPGDASRPPPG